MQKIKFSRTELKNRAATALLTAAPLSVMLLSAIYNLAFGSFGYDITSGIPVLLSCLTVIALIAGTVLAALVCGRVLFGEKLGLGQWAALLCGLAAVVLLRL